MSSARCWGCGDHDGTRVAPDRRRLTGPKLGSRNRFHRGRSVGANQGSCEACVGLGLLRLKSQPLGQFFLGSPLGGDSRRFARIDPGRGRKQLHLDSLHLPLGGLRGDCISPGDIARHLRVDPLTARPIAIGDRSSGFRRHRRVARRSLDPLDNIPARRHRFRFARTRQSDRVPRSLCRRRANSRPPSRSSLGRFGNRRRCMACRGIAPRSSTLRGLLTLAVDLCYFATRPNRLRRRLRRLGSPLRRGPAGRGGHSHGSLRLRGALPRIRRRGDFGSTLRRDLADSGLPPRAWFPSRYGQNGCRTGPLGHVLSPGVAPFVLSWFHFGFGSHAGDRASRRGSLKRRPRIQGPTATVTISQVHDIFANRRMPRLSFRRDSCPGDAFLGRGQSSHAFPGFGEIVRP